MGPHVNEVLNVWIVCFSSIEDLRRCKGQLFFHPFQKEEFAVYLTIMEKTKTRI
jgi:hypothetical protein